MQVADSVCMRQVMVINVQLTACRVWFVVCMYACIHKQENTRPFLCPEDSACMSCNNYWFAANEDLEEDGINLAAPKRRKRTWEQASDEEDVDPEAAEAAHKEAEMEADRSV